MNCKDREEKLALFAGGDLAAEEAREVEQHLADCPGCQVFLNGITQTLAVLRVAHQDPIPPAHYAAVRARVMAELGPTPRSWQWVAWPCAAALVLAVFAALSVWPKRAVAPHVVAKAISRPVVTQAAGARALPVRARRSHVAAAHRIYGRQPVLHWAVIGPAQPRQAETAENVVIKLVTDDPQVVIYWLGDPKGDD